MSKVDFLPNILKGQAAAKKMRSFYVEAPAFAWSEHLSKFTWIRCGCYVETIIRKAVLDNDNFRRSKGGQEISYQFKTPRFLLTLTVYMTCVRKSAM